MNQDLKSTLWAAANRPRARMDAAECKHIVLDRLRLPEVLEQVEDALA